ncbi:MAG: hypothetical protein HY056_09705 [Proteobacteria bacterium]|nr:hypothetical protein [Pseudomonadota bacterium]
MRGLAVLVLGPLALAASPAHGQARVEAGAAALAGVAITATATPLRRLGFLPTRTLRFTIAVAVAARVPAFSALRYQCRFRDQDGGDAGPASGGVIARDAFARGADGRLLAQASEDLTDIGPLVMACRATRLEK